MSNPSRPRIDWAQLPLVMVGGAFGVFARYLLTADGGLAIVPVIAINVTGSILLGVLAGALGDRSPRLRSLFGTGLLGGFTSYSALAPVFAIGAYALAAPAVALLYAGVTLAIVAASVAGAIAGLSIGRALARRSA